jgi:hypothetical protein
MDHAIAPTWHALSTAANASAQRARIEAALRPNEEQEAKLKALQNAAAQAAEQLAASCPSEMPPPARLAAISKTMSCSAR